MKQKLWRLIKTRYAKEALSGEGARIYGGRWTSPGHSVIYCAQHLSLAILEILVHTESNKMLTSYSKIALEIPTSQIHQVTGDSLPTNWDTPFPGSDLQKIGDEWLKSCQSLVLKIPSAVVHEECNYLINPKHQDFDKLNILQMEPTQLDMRLFGSL